VNVPRREELPVNYWLEHCLPPRDRKPGVTWDVFISYRSLDRSWATALYDMLKQRGYEIFLDQYVLVPGQGLATQLAENLDRSNSGVLVWSERAADSGWVKNELNAMISRRTASEGGPDPFYFIVASVDGKKPPGLADGSLYLDFSQYPDGPTGAEIVKLAAGLQGQPPQPGAVSRIAAVEQQFSKEPAELRALAKVGRFDEIVKRAQNAQSVAYTTSATLHGVAVDQLIRARQYPLALEAVQSGLALFPSSLRLRQLQGLALRRNKQIDDARFQLELLAEEGHRDPETLGMLAAVYADLWEAKLRAGSAGEARNDLEQSRNLYREGFTKVPTDTYVGINAASKTALLGDIEGARALARLVLTRITEQRKEPKKVPADYWELATEAEAQLLLGEYPVATTLYHDAKVANGSEKGSIDSTKLQVERLLSVLPVPVEARRALTAEFGIAD